MAALAGSYGCAANASPVRFVTLLAHPTQMRLLKEFHGVAHIKVAKVAACRFC